MLDKGGPDMADGPTCVDLFCGAGGLSLGLKYAGFDILVATDYHETAGETYSSNLDEDFLQADITNLAQNIDPLLEAGGFDLADVDVLVGGPPCKGFSTVGVYNPDDPRNSLLHKYIDVLELIQPDAILIENVPGVKSTMDGAYVERLLTRTRSLGYNTQMMELNAADYGVPQHRNRVFFIGYQDSHPVSRPPQTHVGDIGQQRLTSSQIQREYVTTSEAIDDLAFLGPGEAIDEYMDSAVSDYQKLMRHRHNGKLYNHEAPDHSLTVQERFRAMDPGDSMDDLPPRHQTSKHSLRKLHPERPAGTVTTLPEDFVHYSRARIPTVREMARLQSFPDWFEFKGPRTTGGEQRVDSLPQYSQVGNAVPPILAEAIGRHVRATLENKDQGTAVKKRLERMEMNRELK